VINGQRVSLGFLMSLNHGFYDDYPE